MTPEEIKLSGERHVTADLTAKGYLCVRNKRARVPTGIEAIKGNEVMLVLVKAAVHPDIPDDLSAEESARVKKRAVRMDWEAWLAQVKIDGLGTLLEPVAYRRICGVISKLYSTTSDKSKGEMKDEVHDHS